MNIQQKSPTKFDNSYFRELDGFYVPWKGGGFPAPKLLKFNDSLAQELDLDATGMDDEAKAATFSGNALPDGSEPLAQVYAGHQFGGFSPQLGDGRALLVGEVIDQAGNRRDIQLKGSGRTPFSRQGDGKAGIGPVLREYLIGEAMHALGVPTTRALAAVATGESILRQEGSIPGAVLTRVAASHIRVGTFQYFAARGETDKIRRLADYSIDRHYPALASDADIENRYLALLEAVGSAQASLVAHWMGLGFVHGVMNTDNMTISGETIDYGPCAFMDAFDPAAVFSSIDHQGRYAYANQPAIAQWNLARFAETLLALIDNDADQAVEKATAVVTGFGDAYKREWLAIMRAKLGLGEERDGDFELANGLASAMHKGRADFTQTFRALSKAVTGSVDEARALFEPVQEFDAWLERWSARREQEDGTARDIAAAMDRINPVYIPRNHKVEEALLAATKEGDLAPFNALLDAVTDPFGERDGLETFARPAPAEFNDAFMTFCGT